LNRQSYEAPILLQSKQTLKPSYAGGGSCLTMTHELHDFISTLDETEALPGLQQVVQRVPTDHQAINVATVIFKTSQNVISTR
jgi:hypothetical protein